MNSQSQIDDLDCKILETLKPDKGMKLGKIAYLLRVNVNTLRYRLLTLQVMGLAVRGRFPHAMARTEVRSF